MCLSWAFFEIAALATASKERLEVAKSRMHARISCANTEFMHLVNQWTGRHLFRSRHPVKGAPCVVFPISAKHSDMLVPLSCEVSCLASELQAYTRPYDFVPYCEHEDSKIRYRSLSGPATASYMQCEAAPQIPELEVIVNPDGGVTALVRISAVLGQRTSLSPDERAKLHAPLLECVEQGLVKAGIDAGRVFGHSGDDPTEEAFAKFEFIGMLLESVSPGCDIVVGIPAEGKSDGTFTFEFDLGVKPKSIPLLGLTHGDQKPMDFVEEDVFLSTNEPELFSYIMRADTTREDEEEDEGYDVHLICPPPEQYCKDYYKEGHESHDPYHYELRYEGKRGEKHSSGNDLWKKSQLELQANVRDTVFEKVGQKYNGGALGIINLNGYDLPRNTVSAAVHLNFEPYNNPRQQEKRRAQLKRRREEESAAPY